MAASQMQAHFSLAVKVIWNDSTLNSSSFMCIYLKLWRCVVINRIKFHWKALPGNLSLCIVTFEIAYLMPYNRLDRNKTNTIWVIFVICAKYLHNATSKFNKKKTFKVTNELKMFSYGNALFGQFLKIEKNDSIRKTLVFALNESNENANKS